MSLYFCICVILALCKGSVKRLHSFGLKFDPHHLIELFLPKGSDLFLHARHLSLHGGFLMGEITEEGLFLG